MKGEPLGAISEDEVYEAVLTGEIVETYPDDKPYPERLDSRSHKKWAADPSRCCV